MKKKKEIEGFLKELESRRSGFANMNYERSGAILILKWVLEIIDHKPIIGYR